MAQTNRVAGSNPYNPHAFSHPGSHPQINPSFVSTASSATMVKESAEGPNGRETLRTPSPTPSELKELMKTGIIDWEELRNWRFWLRREWLWRYIIITIILVLVILVSLYDKQIVHWITPTAEKIKKIPAGWVIPIAILFVISFPPLFGHEIVAIVVGLVWGLWVGFAIVCAGTFLGELANFYAFKYCCSSRGDKLEKNNIQYACLTRVVREGGFTIALIARLSAIPGHFTTAVFATCGMNIWVFSIAAILSLPKQFVTVYVGFVLEQSGEGSASTKNKIIEDSVLGVSLIITVAAAWYIYSKMAKVKPDVIHERRRARRTKTIRDYPYSHQPSSSVFNPRGSESEIPLNPGEEIGYQQWDSQGRAVGIAGDPLVAPVPRKGGPVFHAEADGGYGGYDTRVSPIPVRETQQYSEPSFVPPTGQYPNPFEHESHTEDDDAYDVQLRTPVLSGPPPPQPFTSSPRPQSRSPLLRDDPSLLPPSLGRR